MNFVSLEFLILLVIVISLYHCLTHKRQNRLLLISSYIFYGWWDYRFLSLLFISSVVDYFCAIEIDSALSPSNSQQRRKSYLSISLVTNLVILGTFKYFGFFYDSFLQLGNTLGLGLDPFVLKIILPVGISFYTFQTMSYTIDVYRRNAKATKHFFDFMLYVSFFVQLVAGPIERGHRLLPQILKERQLTRALFLSGLQLAIWGYFKKIFIADNLAPEVKNIFLWPSEVIPTGSMIVLGVFAFSFQIYCDFSGYTDIARGIARMLGFNLMRNFNLPYFAINPRDFWQRWHISLSSWFRDYFYKSLGGNRRGYWLHQRNVAATFLLSGLWHGASWHFVLWGAYHAILFFIYSLFTERQKSKDATFERRSGIAFWASVLLFFSFTCFGWLIFRAHNGTHLLLMLQSLFSPTIFSPLPKEVLLKVIYLVTPLVIFQVYQYYRDIEAWISWPNYGKAIFYIILFNLALAYTFGYPKSSTSQPFIYFQF